MLHCAPTTLVATPFILKTPPYDPLKDFTYITHMADATLSLVVANSLPVNTVTVSGAAHLQPAQVRSLAGLGTAASYGVGRVREGDVKRNRARPRSPGVLERGTRSA